MKITIDKTTRCITPHGRIDANTCHELDTVLEQFPDHDQVILIDLSNCDYLSSAGIRVLLKARKRMNPATGMLYLAGVSAAVMQILDTAGLHSVFHIEAKTEDVLRLMASKRVEMLQPHAIVSGGYAFLYQPFDIAPTPGYLWKASAMVSYQEFGFGIGTGAIAETGNGQIEQTDLLVVSGHCVGFMPIGGVGEADFSVTNDPVRAGIPLTEAISFGHQPSGVLRLRDPGQCSLQQISASIQKIKKELLTEDSLVFAVAISNDCLAPSIALFLPNEPPLRKVLRREKMHHLEQIISDYQPLPSLMGITYHLGELELQSGDCSISVQLNDILTFEHVLRVEASDSKMILTNPVVLLFAVHEFADGTTSTVSIETPTGFNFPPHFAFLTRRLYADALRVVIEPLHGGFSAQTFHVVSFDARGRQMGPTVLKISNRALIARESDRCRKYALPYIFNNSAVVQGTEFHGDTGALRYNFVGIGGEESRLQWLTHFYHQEGMEVLDPLFDKIFMKILKPWYGQSLQEPIEPFSDHDPTLSFFPFIYDVVKEVLGVSSDQQYLTIPELPNPILNPYWYLKNEYPRLRSSTILYHSGICHGDLNMQNILLDEKMNVYLIDFSETRPRSVVSDFTRLEAIFMVDNAPVATEEDFVDYLDFIQRFYSSAHLNEMPDIHYVGRHQEKILKNTALTMKMRKYAFDCTGGNADSIPYYIALLEWVLPIVCYNTAPLHVRRLSMILASKLCDQLTQRFPVVT